MGRKKKKKKPKQHYLNSLVECVRCGKKVQPRQVTRFEPFNYEVYNEKIPTCLCPDCAWRNYQDV